MEKNSRNHWLGLALAACLAGIPFIFPNLNRLVTRGIAVPLAVFLLVILLYSWPATRVKSVLAHYAPKSALARLGLLLLAAVGLGAGWYYLDPQAARSALGAASKQTDEALPGFAIGMSLNLHAAAPLRDKYIFKYRTPENVRAEFYLAANDVFNFVITDVRGEPHVLQVPLGPDGLPVGQWIFLVCEAGSDNQHSFLSVAVNGRELKRSPLAFPMDMGSRQWKFALSPGQNGLTGNAFEIASISKRAATLTAAEKKKWAGELP